MKRYSRIKNVCSCRHQDQLILNYVLNGEYVQAEFYSCATTGEGLPASVRGSTNSSSGCAMAALSTSMQARRRVEVSVRLDVGRSQAKRCILPAYPTFARFRTKRSVAMRLVSCNLPAHPSPGLVATRPLTHGRRQAFAVATEAMQGTPSQPCNSSALRLEKRRLEDLEAPS